MPSLPTLRPSLERQRSIANEGAVIRLRSTAFRTSPIRAADPSLARKYLELGALLVAVSADTTLLSREAGDLAKSLDIQGSTRSSTGGSSPY